MSNFFYVMKKKPELYNNMVLGKINCCFFHKQQFILLENFVILFVGLIILKS